KLAAGRCQNSQARTPALRSAAVSAAGLRGVPPRVPCLGTRWQCRDAPAPLREAENDLRPQRKQNIAAWAPPSAADEGLATRLRTAGWKPDAELSNER